MLTFFLTFLFCSAQALTIPPFQGDVFDETKTLSEIQKKEIAFDLQKLRTDADVWMAVYLAASLQHESIETVTQKTFESWKLGQAGKNNGLLLVIVPSERRMRFEVGYGLEPILTDAWTLRLQETVMIPQIKEGNFSGGIRSAIREIKLYRLSETTATRSLIPSQLSSQPIVLTALNFYFIASLLYLLAFLIHQIRQSKAPKIIGGIVGNLLIAPFISVFIHHASTEAGTRVAYGFMYLFVVLPALLTFIFSLFKEPDLSKGKPFQVIALLSVCIAVLLFLIVYATSGNLLYAGTAIVCLPVVLFFGGGKAGRSGSGSGGSSGGSGGSSSGGGSSGGGGSSSQW